MMTQPLEQCGVLPLRILRVPKIPGKTWKISDFFSFGKHMKTREKVKCMRQLELPQISVSYPCIL